MKLHIEAVDGRRVSLLDDSGRVRPGRCAGRDASGAALPEGEIVPDLDHYRRAARRGDITIVEEIAQ